MTIDPKSLDLFQLFKILTTVLEYLSEKFDDLELGHLKDKLEKSKEVLNNLDN